MMTLLKLFVVGLAVVAVASSCDAGKSGSSDRSHAAARHRHRHHRGRARPRARALPTPGPAGYCRRSGDGIYAQADRRPGCTPGLWVSDPRVKQTPAASEYDPDTSAEHVCSKPYNPRPPESVTGALKREDLSIYGLPAGDAASTESDHYYPVWLGGATVLQNLYPEPNYPRAQDGGFVHNPKDALEIGPTGLYGRVCRQHSMTVRQARRVFEARSWLPGYRRYVGPTS